MDLSRFKDLFLSESREHLGAAHEIHSQLESDPRETGLWNAFMRHAHSLKGMAASMQYPSIVELTHAAESLAERLEGEAVEQSRAYLPMLAETLACLGQLLDRIERGEEAVSDRAVELARRLRDEDRETPSPAPAVAAPPLAAPPVDPAPPAACWQIDLELGGDGPVSSRSAVATLGRISRLGRVVRSGPPSLSADPLRVIDGLRLVLQTDAGREAIERDLRRLVGAGNFALEPAPASARPAPDRAPASAWIRVRSDVLESIVEGALELRQEQGRLERSIVGPASATRHHLQRCDFLLKELYAALMELHLVPFDTLAQRMHQTVVGLASELGRDVQFEISGGQVRLDRHVLEMLIDPLLHALRNAVDHGIEPPAERVAAGKPPRGRLRLALERSGERIRLVVADDGRGMRPEVLRRTAVERGLLDADDAAELTDEEALLLTTLPRFSTRREATNVSGRGVGLDVVRQRLKDIGGFLEIRSEAGRGTELHLAVPLRRALIATLVVRAGGALYALPVETVAKIVDARELAAPDASETPPRVIDLQERLEGSVAEPPCLTPRALFLAGVSPPAALVVDDVLGRRDLVAQPLHAPLARLRHYSGVALLEEGAIVPILDPRALTEG